MKKSTSIRTASMIMACLLNAAIALPIWGDALISGTAQPVREP